MLSLAGAALVTQLLVASAAVLLLRAAHRATAPALAGRLAALLALATLACGLGQQLCVSTSRFTFLRLLAQVVFGTLPVLLALLAVARRRRADAPWLAGLCAVLLLVYVYAYHVEPYRLQTREHVIATDHGPALRIVHVSDIQTNRIGPHEERAWQEVRDAAPDLLVLTGDYIQPRAGDDAARAEHDFRMLLRRLPVKPRLGAWALQGDVETTGWGRLFEGTSVVPLEDGAVDLDGGAVRLVGLSRRGSRARDAARVRELLGPDTGQLRIVAGHAPDFVDALAGRVRVDLVLAGHTHGGQVALPLLGPPLTLSRLPRRYAAGLEDYGGVPLHVSRGVGMERGTAPEVRFLCPPEVCVLTLRPRASAQARLTVAASP